MACIVIAPVTFNLAETTRGIEVARALGADHRIVFLAYEPEYVHLIHEAGFEVRQLAPVMSPKERAQALALDQGRGFRHPFTRDFVRRRVAAERQLIRDVKADAVVHFTNVTSLISARAEGVPIVYPVPFALTRPHVEQVKRLGLIRGKSPVARAADRVASGILRLIYARLSLAPRAFSAVARENGVEPIRTMADLFAADWNLLTVLPEELDGISLPENYRRAGPIFAKLDGEVPAVVRELAAAPEPLIYLALGSSGNRSLALAAAQALGDMDVNVVAPLRHFLRPDDEVPPNVHLVDLIPAHLIGDMVDAAVLHGGQGTVQTACATGVPFVGIGLQPEQVWNVDVCARRGNAVALSRRDVGGARFSRAVEQVLHDPSVRAAAAQAAKDAQGEDGAAAVARFVIEELPGLQRPPGFTSPRD